jgi:hypothetical protein
MGWPDLRFEKFYEAFQRRKVIEELTWRKLLIGAAVYGNSNYDGEENKGKREEWLKALEENFQQQVYDIYHPGRKERENEAMRKDPFFQAMYRGLEKQGITPEE